MRFSPDPTESNDVLIEEIRIVEANIMQEPKYTGAIPKSSSSALIKPKVEYLPHNFQPVVDKINQGYRVAIILRGLPGSGKSFLSYQIIEQSVKTKPEDHIVSADRYFINNRGQYKFDPSKLPDAHSWSQQRFAQCASRGLSPLIVDNTNIKSWELFPYLQIATQYGYHVEIMEPATPWKLNVGFLAKKNQHLVPEDKIKQMKSSFEPGSVENLMQCLNLQTVREPKMRNDPPLQSVKEIIPEKPFQTLPLTVVTATDSPLPKSSPSPSPQDVTDFDNIFDKNWDAVQPEVEVEKEQIVPEQPQRKQKKNKPPAKKLSPHRKDCPNENATFAIVRNMYSTCNDSYLWDFFVRCKGDADWCVNLLCDENLTDQMDAGCSLTCNCFGNEVSKVVVEKAKKVAQPQPSPTVKSKKAKTDAAKQINVDDWLETKEIIEKSIQIGHEHYPDHVNKVRGWKSGQDVTPAEQDNVTRFDERQELTIDRSLILELDVKYGEGLLEGVLGREIRFPSKIMIRKSTAFQLYLEIMEAHYVPEEDSRLKMLKADEELAKKLNDEENKKNEKKPEILMNGNNVWANMNNGDDGDDIALKMSKEKLVQLFPGLNKNDLLEIFEGTGYNFDDTVSLIEDSLITTPEERKEIAASKRKIFNSPWHDESEKKTVVVVERPTVSSDTGYTEEHLKTLEDLRQEIDYHQEEQKVCKMKAQESHQKKQYELATYYSNVAFFHHGREAEKKHEGANLMAGIHEKTHGSNSETVDLHFHSVLEATAVLDNFLDRQIEKLRKIKKPWVELSIITGKGTHSSNGLANIKIKTKSRLMERNLHCTEYYENAGMVYVKIYPSSVLTIELQ